LFVNCLIDNPSFDSQTKENMTTKVSEFGGPANERFHVTEKFSKALLKTEILEAIVSQARAKANSKLNKALKGTKTARLFGIEKLDDANEAGRKGSAQCTLILTEGDSAKSLVMAAIDVIGRDYYGVFPLRGKLLNVRDASST
jgi:DNA topoisomerase-2